MREFSFHPELYEHRERAIEALSAHGFEIFADYSTVDLEHELYGLEVGGFQEQDVAVKVLDILRTVFPHWNEGAILELSDSPPWWAALTKYAPKPHDVEY